MLMFEPVLTSEFTSQRHPINSVDETEKALISGSFKNNTKIIMNKNEYVKVQDIKFMTASNISAISSTSGFGITSHSGTEEEDGDDGEGRRRRRRGGGGGLEKAPTWNSSSVFIPYRR